MNRQEATTSSDVPRILYVTKRIDRKRIGGRELLCLLNIDCLRAIYGDRLSVVELGVEGRQGGSPIRSLMGYIDGSSKAAIADACSLIRRESISKVFVDGSNLGRMVAGIKSALPHVHVCTFFHNVEARFFWGAFKRRRTPRSLAVIVANYIAERLAVRASDTIISLSKRDSALLKSLYGRGATFVSPMAIRDTRPQPTDDPPADGLEKYLLFVGGAFYANKAGIEWFAANVAPHLLTMTCVVGRGLEDHREALEKHRGVKVIGSVDSLADWYRDAHLVIAPIFDGSGMKTKVAEALMYGKYVIGTPEAFSGYEEITATVGWKCGSAEEFIKTTNELHARIFPSFDVDLRRIYEKRYSLEAAVQRMAMILESNDMSNAENIN